MAPLSGLTQSGSCGGITPAPMGTFHMTDIHLVNVNRDSFHVFPFDEVSFVSLKEKNNETSHILHHLLQLFFFFFPRLETLQPGAPVVPRGCDWSFLGRSQSLNSCVRTNTVVT